MAYREKNGPYQKIEDIMNVEGIKEGVFQKIKEVWASEIYTVSTWLY